MYRHHYNLGFFFEEVAQRTAGSPALRRPESITTYGELLQNVKQLAAYLVSCGLQRGDVIAIAHNKHFLSYALMLAALRVGIPYVNIDSEAPINRNARILKVSCARMLFVDDEMYRQPALDLASQCGIPSTFLPMVKLDEASLDAQQQMTDVDGASIAYIMFTSGSTGTPKGVAVTHQNVLHFIQWGVDRFDIKPDDNFANLSPMYFDNSVFDFYVGLFSGASLTPVPRSLMNTPQPLIEHVRAMRCSIWFSVPSLLIYLSAMKTLSMAALPDIRFFVFGGEGYPKPELIKLHRNFGTQARLVNVYGPTECTCICSAHEITEADFVDMTGLPTLGHLNPNFDYRILDDSGSDSTQGELCLIGPNVAAGYFNDPGRTVASFYVIDEPHRFGKRAYRTGDIVREDADRKLWFVGRKDNQIKHMGYRIELEEIEHALGKLPGVYQAAAIYLRLNTAFGKIIGFVSSSGPLDESTLQSQLAEHLPSYMIPSRIVVVDKLPKNPNGKIDRQALADLV